MQSRLSTVAASGIVVATVGLLVVAALAPMGVAGGTQASEECEFPVTMTDVTGTEVTVEEEPERVVVLQPSDAQTMWDIGARDQVVGLPRTPYTGYLEGVGNRTNVKNDDLSVNVEQVVALEPDVVIASNTTRPGTIESLRRSNVTVYHFDLVTEIEEIYAHVNETGRLTGNCEGAAETVADVRGEVRAIEEAIAGNEEPRVLYYFFQYTTGNGTHIHDMVETAGGQNIVANAGVEGYRSVNTETVLERDPQWIVYPSDSGPPSGSPYNATTAFEHNQTLELNYNYVSQPGPRFVQPLSTMAQAFHPDSFEDGEPITPTATPTPAAATTEGSGDAAAGTPTDEPTATSTPTSSPTVVNGPGFGLVAALVAVLAAALALAGRKGS